MTRLMRLELRHSATPWILPLLAVLLFITPLARNLTPVALWLDRSVDVEGSVQLIGPFAGGVGAWMAYRERRRRLDDLLGTVPHSPWTRAMVTWLASLGWIVAFYLGLWAVFFAITATQATWGSPLWLPGLTGLAATVLCSAAGFAAGLWWPTRYVAPVTAVATLGAILGLRAAVPNDRALGPGLLSPIYPSFGLDASVFYHPRPDLPVLKLALYAGLLAVALAATVLHARDEPRRVRRGGVVLLVAGLALSSAACGMETTVRNTGHGVVLPAWHPAVTARAVPYTPVCSHAPLPVCVHPAYAGGHEPAVLSGILNGLTVPVLGIPGMPVRAEQMASANATDDGAYGVRGDPPTLYFGAFIMHGGTLQPPAFDRAFKSLMALSLFTATGAAHRAATPVQQALALYLLQQAHDSPEPRVVASDDPAIATAAARFTVLPSQTRTAWLTTHLATIRADSLTLEEIP
jgi:hypothetical protein